jgi:hypothetical protein
MYPPTLVEYTIEPSDESTGDAGGTTVETTLLGKRQRREGVVLGELVFKAYK